MSVHMGFDREGQPIAVSLERAKLQETAGRAFLEAWELHQAALRAEATMKHWQEQMHGYMDERDAIINVIKELRINQEEAIGWVLGQPEPPKGMEPIETNEHRRRAREKAAQDAMTEQRKLVEHESTQEVVDKDS